MNQIQQNKRKIRNNRIVIALVVVVFAANTYLTRHSMHDCEERLYEKITGKKSPSEEELKSKWLTDTTGDK